MNTFFEILNMYKETDDLPFLERVTNISYDIGCPNKHKNSLMNSISCLLRFSIVIPDFKSHNIFMSAIVYSMVTINGCKELSIKSPQDEQ